MADTAETVTHSPLPWFDADENILDSNGCLLTYVRHMPDAAFIVKAVNHHAELVDALKKILEGFDGGVFVRSIAHDDDSAWAMRYLPYLKALADAQAVLAKVAE